MAAGNSTPSFLSLAMMLGTAEAALDEEFWQKACELCVSIPAIVVSFDATHQTVVVQPAIQDTLLKSLVPTPTNLPQLSNVPVVLPRAGGFTLTMPIQTGDECLVVFADRCIDAWWQSGGSNNAQIERRRHDLTDGQAIFGLWSQPRVLTAYSTSKAQLRSDDGTTSVEVGSGEVTITPDSGTSVIKITAGEIDLTATLVKINGVNFHAHIHSGVTVGGGVTGPVTP